MAGGGRESRRFSIPAPVLRAEAKQQTGFARPTYESALASVGGVTLGAGIGVLFSLRLFPAAPGLGAMLGAVTGLFLAAASPLGTWPEEVGMGMWGSGATVLGLEAFGWQPAGSGSTPAGIVRYESFEAYQADMANRRRRRETQSHPGAGYTVRTPAA